MEDENYSAISGVIFWLLVLFPIIVGLLQWAIETIVFKIKYPIISETPPMRIMERDDVAILDDRKYYYTGVSDDLNHYFTSDSSPLFDLPIKRDVFYKSVTSIYCKKGIKWKKPNKANHLSM